MNKKLLTSKTKELQHGQSLAERLAIDRFLIYSYMQNHIDIQGGPKIGTLFVHLKTASHIVRFSQIFRRQKKSDENL